MPWCHRCGYGPVATSELRRSPKREEGPHNSKIVLFLCRDRIDCSQRVKEKRGK